MGDVGPTVVTWADPAGGLSYGAGPGVKTWNIPVTPLIQEAANGDAFDGILMKLTDVGDNWVSIASKDHATGAAPKLIIDYTPEPATLFVLALGGLALFRRR